MEKGVRRLILMTSTSLVVLGGLTAEASELPSFAMLLGSANVQESSANPTLTLGGMPASPHQIAVLTPRPRNAEQASSTKLTTIGSSAP